jgi:ferrochelatase
MKIAVLLLNYGCPDSPRAVYNFLYNLFNDRAIIPLPWPLRPLLARHIARRRFADAADNYARIGGSPMLRIIQRQCRALGAALQDEGEVQVYAGMRYWHPFIADTMSRIAAWGPDRLIALPLFPHYCSATTGTVFGEVRRHAGHLQQHTSYVQTYHDDPDYLAAVAATITDTLAQHQAPSETVVLFSAHGVPQRLVERGDPYVHHIKDSAAQLAKRLAYPAMVSYQSQVGRVRWYGASTLDTVATLGRQGNRSLAVVPLSFTSENVETLYELDVLVKDAAQSAGIQHYMRIPTVDVSPRYIKALAGLVRTALHCPGVLNSAVRSRA